MYMRCLRRAAARKPASPCFSPNLARSYSIPKNSEIVKTCEPLRILFCGSDDFSNASLLALFKEYGKDRKFIQSLEVLCRPGKPVGRSLKTIQDVPIKPFAQKLGLTVHERDTFTDWKLPQTENGPFNLIITVSFGLFVPPRILNSVEYGGLNVHPSLLPQYRGSAPIQHTIMNGDTTTGISVQTLDPNHFDSGRILAQTRPKGLTIPSPSKITYFGLHEILKGRAAEMLVQSLQDKVFIPPIYDLGWYHEFALSNSKELVHATKITPADRQIDWYDFSPEKIDRYHRALGRLWSDVQVDGKIKKRVIFEDFEIVTMPPFLREWFRTLESSGSNGRPIERSMDKDVRFFVYERDMSFRPQIYFPDEDKAIILANPTNPKSCIRVREVTVEGGVKKPAYRALREFKHWEVWDLSRDRTGVFKVDSKEEG